MMIIANELLPNHEENILIGEAEETISLDRQIEQLIHNSPVLKQGLIGISIRSATTNELLYEHNGDLRLTPASNMKLLTAAAALSTLGKEYQFTTSVFTDGKIRGNQLNGNLYLKGRGDPTLRMRDMSQFAQQLKQMGISEITGDVIGDDSWYDDVAYSADMIWIDEQKYYGAQISALTASPDDDFDAGTVIIEVEPANQAGAKPTITVVPQTDYVTVRNRATTLLEGQNQELTIWRKHGENTIIVDGTIPINSPTEKEWVAVSQPTGYALDLFLQALKEQGIRLEGTIKQADTPVNAKVLVNHQSDPLSKLMLPFMKLSNNTHAEILIKEMGRVSVGEGSWEKGIDQLKKEVDMSGMDTDSLIIRDGSGISHLNLLTANSISSLLFSVQQKKWFDTYLNALPVAGVSDRLEGGTMRYRLKDKDTALEVRAKTGTLTSVSSLSGYLGSKGDQKIIFSILINHVLDESKAKDVEDSIVSILSEYIR